MGFLFCNFNKLLAFISKPKITFKSVFCSKKAILKAPKKELVDSIV